MNGGTGRWAPDFCAEGPGCPELVEHILWREYMADPEAPCVNCGHPWSPEPVVNTPKEYVPGVGHQCKQTAAVHCTGTERTPMGSCMCEQVRPMNVSNHVILARLGMQCDLPAVPMAVGGGIFELLNGRWAFDFFISRYGLDS